MLKTAALNKTYRTEEVETVALSNINLHIHQGEFVSIMGPSGCGKTSLLNILGLLDSPSSGSYFFNDIDVAPLSEKERASLRKEQIGFVFQNFNLIDELSVFENVELPLIYLDIPKKKRKEAVEKVLEKLGMLHRASHFPAQLSGGQQQRVAVSRALVNEPKLILADEPTGNLDSKNGNDVMDALAQLNEQGTTIVMVTHSSHDAAFSGRTIRLLDGELIAENKSIYTDLSW